MNDLATSVAALKKFSANDLSWQLSDAEYKLKGCSIDSCVNLNQQFGVNRDLVRAAAELKKVAGQINVVIHALGMLQLLPEILETDEQIIEVSLGAASTGKAYDLTTDRRLAEFKFIAWKGGSEVPRQNSLFKDFYRLAEAEDDRAKYLYVLDSKHPIKFMRSGRGLNAVFARNQRLGDEFRAKYGEQFKTVGEYYETKKDVVQIVDVSHLLPPELVGAALIPSQEAEE